MTDTQVESGWSEPKAHSLVARTIKAVAGVYVEGAYDAPTWRKFDKGITEAFAKRDHQRVVAGCHWFLEQMRRRCSARTSELRRG